MDATNPSDLTDAEPTLRTAKVARVLGVSVQTVRSWSDAGMIRCYRTLGGHRLFPLSEVRSLLRRVQAGDGKAEGSDRGVKGSSAPTDLEAAGSE